MPIERHIRNASDDSPSKDLPASALIDAKIASRGDWRGATLAAVRDLVKEAVPDVVEEWKWAVPVWSHSGIICTGETYKKVVKLTFPRARRCRIPLHCSTRAWPATCGAPSTSEQGKHWTRPR